MKKIFFIFLMLFAATCAYADMAVRDKVVLDTGRKVRGLVIDVQPDYIRMIVDKEIVKLRFRNMSIDSSSYYRFYKVPEYDPQLIQDLLKPDPLPPPPKNYKDFAHEGISLAEDGKYEEAVKAFSKAIKEKDDIPNFFLFRAGAYQKLGKMEEAIKDYSRAIEEDPKNTMAYARRGWVYQSLGQTERAILDYSKVMEQDPYNFEVLRERYGLYNAEKDWWSALQDLNRIIAMDPEEGEAYLDRAVLTYRLEEYDKTWENVHETLKRGVSVPPKFIEALAKKMPDPFLKKKKPAEKKTMADQFRSFLSSAKNIVVKYVLFIVISVLCAILAVVLFVVPGGGKGREKEEQRQEDQDLEKVEELLRPVSFRPASMVKRMCAVLIDMILMSAVSWALTVMVGVDIFAAAFGIMFLLRESLGGASLGKMIVGLRVVDEYGYPCGFLQCFLRNFPLGLPIILFYVAIWGAQLRVNMLVRFSFLGVIAVFLIEGLVIVFAYRTGRRIGDRLGGTFVHDLHLEYWQWPFYIFFVLLLAGFVSGNTVMNMIYNKAFIYKMNPLRYYNIDHDFSFDVPKGWGLTSEGEGGIVLQNEPKESSIVLVINNDANEYRLDVCVSAFTKALEEQDMKKMMQEDIKVSGRAAVKVGLMKKTEDAVLLLVYFKKEEGGSLYVVQASTVKRHMRSVMTDVMNFVRSFRFE